MKITDINISEELINNGLKPVKMKRLGQVVLLAGQNGSGKTRLLNLIAETINSKPKKSKIDKLDSDIQEHKDAIEGQQRQIESFQKSLETETRAPNIKIAEHQIDQCKNNIRQYEIQLSKYDEIGKWNFIQTNEIAENYTIIPFVPKSLDLKDANNFNKKTLLSNAGKVDTVGVNSLSEGTFARIQVIQDRWHNATHQDSEHPKEDIEEAVVEYESLKELIKIFLNTDLGRNLNGEPTLFGFSLGQSNLSDGQKVLLQLCLAIHCQDEKLENLILFLDEPENHLHPSVLIQTIERVLEKIPNGQLWISTHSIPLLSYFDPSNIWYVENNKISYAGTGPEKVLKSLVGDENRISKLQDFISLPGQLALNRHAFESLFHPEVVMTDSSDPQTLQIRDELKGYVEDDAKIRVLDYGVGKGRLLANILSSITEPISNFNKRFEYVAYDKYPEDKDECLKTYLNTLILPKKTTFTRFLTFLDNTIKVVLTSSLCVMSFMKFLLQNG